MTDTRTVSKSLRIPITLDDKIKEFTKTMQVENPSKTMIGLIQLGLLFYEKFEQLQTNPEEMEKIAKEKGEILYSITSEENILGKLRALGDEELDKVFLMSYNLMKSRIKENTGQEKTLAMRVGRSALSEYQYPPYTNNSRKIMARMMHYNVIS
jgi:hypothetical protein